MPIHEIFKPISVWIRRIVRERTMPVPRDVAEDRRLFFSVVYFLSALGLTVFVLSDIAKREIYAVPYVRNSDKKISFVKFENFEIQSSQELTTNEYKELMNSEKKD